MRKQYSQIRIWKETLKILKHIHAETGLSLIAIIDELAKDKWKEIQNNAKNN